MHIKDDIYYTILDSDPSISAIVELQYLTTALTAKQNTELAIAPKLKYVAPAATIVAGLLGLATAGIGTAILFGISLVGTGAAIQNSLLWEHTCETNIQYGIKALKILEAIDSHRLASIWKLLGSEKFAYIFNMAVQTLDVSDSGNQFFYYIKREKLSIEEGFAVRLSECTNYGEADLEDAIVEVGEELWQPISVSATEIRTEPKTRLPEFPVNSELKKPSLPPRLFNSELKSLGVPAQQPGVDVVSEFLNPLKSSLLIGEPGSGKGMLTSHLLVAVKNQKKLPIFAVNPKNDPKEDGLWGAVDVLFPRDYPKWKDSFFGELLFEEQIEWINAAIDSYRNWYSSHDRPSHLLVLDDATNIYGVATNDKTTRLNLQSLQRNITTQGDSSRSYLLLLGHATNLSCYGGNRDSWAGVRKYYLYSKQKSGHTAIANAGATSFFGKPLTDAEITAAKQVADRSPCGRALFTSKNGVWVPMAKLPNLSGYDRDTHSFITPPTPEVSQPKEFKPVRLEQSVNPLVKAGDTEALRQILNSELNPSKVSPPSASSSSVDLDEFLAVMRKSVVLKRTFTLKGCHNASKALRDMYGGDASVLEGILDSLYDRGDLSRSKTPTGLKSYRLKLSKKS